MILSKQTALVTGGSRGIGKAIATRFVKEGASVVLFGTNPDRGAKAVKELEQWIQDEQQIAFYPVDVTDTQQVKKTIAKIYKDFGSLDILVNNAGITRDNLLMRLSDQDWEQVINTNLCSVFHTCQAVIRPMMKARRGKIINITSVVGLMGNPGQTNYAAAKSGMVGFTKSLAKEVATRGICVNCIAPGFIETDMTRDLKQEQQQAILDKIPLQRLGKPEDIAHAALFLASAFSGYITGQVLTVDGGMVM